MEYKIGQTVSGYSIGLARWLKDNNCTTKMHNGKMLIVSSIKNIEDKKLNLLSQLNELYSTAVEKQYIKQCNGFTISAPKEERNLFNSQLIEAINYNNGLNDTPLLTAIAKENNISTLEQVEKVLYKSKAINTNIGRLTGIRQVYETQIVNCEDVDKLDTFSISFDLKDDIVETNNYIEEVVDTNKEFSILDIISRS